MSTQPDWRLLDIAIIGGGIGGLAAAISLRRAGHQVTIYEQADFAGEVGAAIACAANGTRWLREWGVDIDKGRPVPLLKMINHTWETGDVCNVYDLSDYEQKWGYGHYIFHRQDMHAMLKDAALGAGDGAPAKLVVNHKCTDIDLTSGEITFKNGEKHQHDLVVGADGIGSMVRRIIGIHPERMRSTSSCLAAIVNRAQAQKLGLKYQHSNRASEYWGVEGINRIVMTPIKNGDLLAFYCFFPREKGDFADQDWSHEASVEELLQPYGDLEDDMKALLKISTEIRPWRLWVHKEYPYWHKGVACIIGDASHPMMPDQAQGAVQTLEDAAALGIIFGKRHFGGDIAQSLKIFEAVRKPRATRVQEAAARARENLNERTGFSSNVTNKNYKVADEKTKLTVEELNLYDMHADVEAKAIDLAQI